MDKRKSSPLSWMVKNYETNSNVIKDYDVLKYREEFIKKLKKKKPAISQAFFTLGCDEQ